MNSSITQNSGFKTVVKTNLVIAVLATIVPALFFIPMKDSITLSQYTSPLKWLCLLGPILLIVAGIQCAKNEESARKFLAPFVAGIVLFISILAPSSGTSFMSAKVFVALFFTFIYFIISFGVESVRFKIFGSIEDNSLQNSALGFIAPVIAIALGYFYDSDYLTKDRFDTHWFAYIGLGISFFFTDAVFGYLRENLKLINQQKNVFTFTLLNSFLWVFFATLFVLV